MRVDRCGDQLMVWAPAKLNLFLEVLDRRPDGYHEIETLMVAIDIFDTLYFTATRRGPIEFMSRSVAARDHRVGRSLGGETDEQSYRVPVGPENLAVRAAELLRRRAGIEAGARMALVKRIPIAAGLGGASSDAAAALLAANWGWGLGWPVDDLAELAAELGSDVPFFLRAGFAVCRGRGERVEPITGLGRYDFVVVRPADGLSTSAVYQRCRPAGQPRPVTGAIAAGRRRGAAALGRCLVNRLQPAACELSPSIERLRGQFARLDVLGHQMSGSGTSYFCLCRHARQARRVAQLLRSRHGSQVFRATSVRAGRDVLTNEREGVGQ
jgi:4-diphosphocytidyl-2-C-methyl-D-erythritol kinase